ncbi:MAG TPA: hypothetical protein VGQ86_07380 [Candidatus Limnocylindria bacterium]|nr:hypothetical protein [Candidatus Limnocylindria bacterium]
MRSRPRPLVVALLTALLLATVASSVADAAVTCGKARWPVKTGTDQDRASIDLAHVVPTTIAALRGLSAPSPRPQDRRVTSTETTVFSITAFITHYKKEPDSDYHIVIADENGLTMVTEIPHPSCVKGQSPVRGGITSARSDFDAVLHAKTSEFTEALPPIPVQVTGVGFFDAPSHGKGAPENGVELHPVIAISFSPATTPGGVVSPPSVIADPGFEGAPGPGWIASSDVITTSPRRDSHIGHGYAWLGGSGTTHTDTLRQTFTVPNGSRVTLSYYLAIDTSERVKTEDYDVMTVELRSPSGARLATLAEYSNLEATKGYVRRTFDLAPYRGQTVVLWFTAEEDQSLQTSFLLDDFIVDVR